MYLAPWDADAHLREGLWDRVPLGVSGEEFSVEVENAESDSPSAPAPGDELASLRLSDRGPNSSRLRRDSEAFFLLKQLNQTKQQAQQPR